MNDVMRAYADAIQVRKPMAIPKPHLRLHCRLHRGQFLWWVRRYSHWHGLGTPEYTDTDLRASAADALGAALWL